MRLSDRVRTVEQEEPAAPEGRSPDRTPARPPTETKATARKDSSATAVRADVRRLVLAELAPRLANANGAATDGVELSEEITILVDQVLDERAGRMTKKDRALLVNELLSDMLGHGPLDGPLADPTVTEVMCNAHDDIWVERDGRLHETELSFRDDLHYRHVIERIVARVGRRVDEASPMVDARLPNGYRVNVVIPPLALNGPALTIRKFADDPYGVQDLISFGTLSADGGRVLEACVEGKLNILVSGGTATGKTTLLNVLSGFIPDGERIITIEDAAELRLQQQHVLSLEARPPNAEGSGEVTIRDLVRNALRMRPDRIVVGEVRGGEALDMLQAMNTGHEGSVTSVHANSPRDALSRLEVLVLMAGYELPVRAIREQIAGSIDLIIQLERLRDGTRVVTSIQEVHGLEGDVVILEEIFAYSGALTEGGRRTGELRATGLRPRFAERLAADGIDLPPAVFARPRSASQQSAKRRSRR